MSVKSDRRYTADHEWAKTTGTGVTVGITHYAVEQLQDITLVNIDLKEGAVVTKGAAFGTVESVKTLSDLFSPLAGKVTKINRQLESQPELVNADCYEAWMVEIEPSDPKEIDSLLDSAAYQKLIEQ